MNAWQLALSRIGVSAAESGCAPTTMSLIPDYFPPARRAFVSAIYICSTSAGILLAFSLGGYIAQHHGWRAALLVASAPGVVLAVLTLAMLREPARGALDDAASPRNAPGSLRTKLGLIFGQVLYRRTLLASALIQVVISVITAWGPTFLLRKFGATASIVGLNFGLGLSILGASCVLASGWMVGHMGLSRFGRSLRTIGLLELAAVGFLLLALLTPNFTVAVVSLSLLFGFSNLYAPTQFVVIQNYVPANMRATASATASMVVILLVQGTAPPIVGAISDALTPRFGGHALDIALMIMAPAMVLSAAQYFRAARSAEIPRPSAATSKGRA